MAPTLLGPTLLATCTTCQYAFPIAAETNRPELPTRCPNCGGLCAVDPTIHPGQAVFLQPLAGPNEVRRWDLIAFQDLASRSTQVKRVWGLPGESIELLQGEARSDGVMLRKSLAELRQVAVPVYDLARGGGCRWYSPGEQPDVRASRATAATATTATANLHVQAGQTYHLQHVRPAAVHPRDVPANQWLQPSPVIDAYSINQGLSTVDHAISDGLIRLQLQRPLNAPLYIAVQFVGRGGERILEVLIDPAESSGELAAVSTAESEVRTDEVPSDADFRIAARQRIELAWCDGRLLLETDLQSRVVEAEELEALPARSPPLQPEWELPEICRITSWQAIDISHFRFARDLYLTSVPDIIAERSSSVANSIADSNADRSGAGTERLAGFYVLGDNLPASRDSRHELGRVPAAQILGRIVASPAP